MDKVRIYVHRRGGGEIPMSKLMDVIAGICRLFDVEGK